MSTSLLTLEDLLNAGEHILFIKASRYNTHCLKGKKEKQGVCYIH